MNYRPVDLVTLLSWAGWSCDLISVIRGPKNVYAHTKILP